MEYTAVLVLMAIYPAPLFVKGSSIKTLSLSGFRTISSLTVIHSLGLAALLFWITSMFISIHVYKSLSRTGAVSSQQTEPELPSSQTSEPVFKKPKGRGKKELDYIGKIGECML